MAYKQKTLKRRVVYSTNIREPGLVKAGIRKIDEHDLGVV